MRRQSFAYLFVASAVLAGCASQKLSYERFAKEYEPHMAAEQMSYYYQGAESQPACPLIKIGRVKFTDSSEGAGSRQVDEFLPRIAERVAAEGADGVMDITRKAFDGGGVAIEGVAYRCR